MNKVVWAAVDIVIIVAVVDNYYSDKDQCDGYKDTHFVDGICYDKYGVQIGE